MPAVCRFLGASGARVPLSRRIARTAVWFESHPIRDLAVSCLCAGGANRRGGGVLVIGHVLAPVDRAAGLVRLLDRNVSHESGWGRTVPVMLTRFEEDAVAGADDLDWAA